MDVSKLSRFQVVGALRRAAAKEDARRHRAKQDADFCADALANGGAMRCSTNITAKHCIAAQVPVMLPTPIQALSPTLPTPAMTDKPGATPIVVALYASPNVVPTNLPTDESTYASPSQVCVARRMLHVRSMRASPSRATDCCKRIEVCGLNDGFPKISQWLHCAGSGGAGALAHSHAHVDADRAPLHRAHARTHIIIGRGSCALHHGTQRQRTNSH
jgi:hypothetical protein